MVISCVDMKHSLFHNCRPLERIDVGKISGNGEYGGMQHVTTCPKCARIYGHNYSVAFAQVE
ncbi:MAG: hydrolase [Vulcanimicrobiota bacterium]